MKKILATLNKAQSKYHGAVSKAEQDIADKVDFEFGIIYQNTDGFCILGLNCASLAPLSTCLKLIEEKGSLSYEDFKWNCI